MRDEPSQIEAISKSLPALHHVKCAFCSYECLLFKTSHLNTLYKSPFDEHREHREKNGMKCPIFALNSDNNNNNLLNSKTAGIDENKEIASNYSLSYFTKFHIHCRK